MPPKQRHTAERIYQRLRDEHGYAGCRSIVRAAVAEWRQSRAEVFVPLAQRPGEAQADFGAAQAVVAGERVTVAFLVVTLPYSDAFFVAAFPKECTETFQEGHARAFRYFGGVPTRISYDNSKVAVATIVGTRARVLAADHPRCRGREQSILDPLHYLAVLERKPGGFDHARPVQDWPLPECFAVLRRRLEANERHGTRASDRVLRLLEEHTPEQLADAVEHAAVSPG